MTNQEPKSSPLREQEKRQESGKPFAKETELHAPVNPQVNCLGFMAGQISAPDDFDRMGSKEIEEMFGGEK